MSDMKCQVTVSLQTNFGVKEVLTKLSKENRKQVRFYRICGKIFANYFFLLILIPANPKSPVPKRNPLKGSAIGSPGWK